MSKQSNHIDENFCLKKLIKIYIKMNNSNVLQTYRDNDGSGILELKYVLLASILSGIDILIFCGNILVIICLLTKNNKYRLRRGNSNEQKRTNIFILNLAFTDLTLSILIIHPNILQVITGKWMLGSIFCHVSSNESKS